MGQGEARLTPNAQKRIRKAIRFKVQDTTEPANVAGANRYAAGSGNMRQSSPQELPKFFARGRDSIPTQANDAVALVEITVVGRARTDSMRSRGGRRMTPENRLGPGRFDDDVIARRQLGGDLFPFHRPRLGAPRTLGRGACRRLGALHRRGLIGPGYPAGTHLWVLVAAIG